MEKSKRSLTVRMKHGDDYGMNEDSNLCHSVRASIKEDSQGTTTRTDNKKRDYENEKSSMHEDSRSHVHQVFQVASHIDGFRSVLHVVNF